MLARALPLARALLARGHTVTLVLPPYDYPADSGQTFHLDGVRVVNVDARPQPGGLWYGLVARRLIAAALAEQPDVVHVFKPKGFAGAVASALWARNRLAAPYPPAPFPHKGGKGCIPPLHRVERGKGGEVAWRGGEGMRPGRVRLVVDTDDWERGWNDLNPYPRWQQAIFALQEGMVLRQADAVTVASRFLQGFALRLGLPHDRVFYIPNGAPDTPHLPVDPADARRRLSLDPDRPLVLLYTRFFEFDPARAAHALAVALAAVPAARVLVVGRGPADTEAAFDGQLAAAGIASRVDRAGWVEPSDLPTYFAAATAALYLLDDTPVNRAKCPAKLVELLAAGVPVAAEAIGQATEYVEPDRTGLLVPPGDGTPLGAAVARLLSDSDLAHDLGSQAAIRVRERFAWSKLAAQAEAVYRE